MATPAWEPGTLYLPGALVVPRTTPPPSPVVLQNPGFEAGNTSGWTYTGHPPSFSKLHPAQGVYTCTFYTNTGDATATFQALNNEQPVCAQGVLINASARVKLATQGVASARVVLVWLNASNVEIGRSEGTLLERPTANDGNYVTATVTGVAPATTASVRIGVTGSVGNGGDVRVDAFDWDYDTAAPIQGLIYKAVQASAGTSASTEPTWPLTLGVTVVDNTVTWEAVAISRIVWQPQAAMVSGATEPTWPTTVLERVADGQVAWEAISRRIEDENCPQSKVVVIAASKVYAADDDVVRYSATVNPRDWSTANDAGYLPYGLQQYGANPIAAMGLYRSNLVIFNANAFHMWQVDEDPANSALLDALPIGSTWHKALAPVSNDLFFLSSQGVRTVSIAGGSTNLAAGDVGMPIDPLVQEAIATAEANSLKVLSTYVPSAGQYWLAFSDYPLGLGIAGDMPDGQVGDPVSTTYTITGGIQPYASVVVSAGAVPSGTSLDTSTLASGYVVIAGVRNAAEAATWTLTVTDALGAVATVNDASTSTADPDMAVSGDFTLRATLGTANDYAARSGATPTDIRANGEWVLAMSEFTLGDGTGDSGLIKSYTNGSLQGTASTYDSQRPQDVTLGASIWDFIVLGLNGRLWGAGVANGELTDAERAYLYNSGAGRRFRDIQASADADAASLWAKLVYAWQLDDADPSSGWLDAKGNKNLTVALGTVGQVVDSQRGRCANFTRAGRLQAVGSHAQGLESAVKVTYFVWARLDIEATDTNGCHLIGRHYASSDATFNARLQGIRAYWKAP